MIRVLALVTVLVTSCSLVPNSVVRVALPPGDAQAAAAWAEVAAHLPAGGPVELVAPDSFPPPDLVWFDGNLDRTDYLEQALAPNASIETLATQAGLPRGWFAPGTDRIYPIAWSPWSWWSTTTVSDATGTDRSARAFVDERLAGALLGGPTSKWEVETAKPGVAWSSWYRAARSGWVPQASGEPTVTLVKGFWWSNRGWNPQRVPELLARLWSRDVQGVWTGAEGWFAVTATPGSRPIEGAIFVLPGAQTPANE